MQRPARIQGFTQAVRRPLKIFASDPLLGRTFGNRAQIEVANEKLSPGPVGPRVEVIDYDGARGCFYEAVDLNNAAVLMQSGLDPSESDPRFHQQMVYAVAMKTIENFDRGLGHSMRLAGVGRRASVYPRLRLFPHAFYGANAFYSRELNGILFGYFLADAENPGPNLPGQTVFTCLSHDVVAHETTHALVRPAAPALPRSLQRGRARVPRGLRRSRRALPALLVPGRPPAAHPADAQRHPQPDAARRARAAVRLRHRERQGAPLGARRTRHPALRLRPRAARPGSRARRGGVRRVLQELPEPHLRPHPHRDGWLGPAPVRRSPPRSREPHRARGVAHRAAGARHVHPRVRLPPARGRHVRRLPPRARHGGLRARACRIRTCATR